MSRRILLADDSVTIQKVIELTFMDDDGFEVRPVSNGDEAVALLSQINPDFVIADVHMPGANGYEVCRRSKQLRPQVPVLLLVGTFELFDENEARAVGADSFLKKPFDSQELLQRVQELLGRSGAAAAPELPAELPLASLDLPPMAASPELPAEPSWGSFSLEAEPPPFPTAPEPFTAPAGFEPFDREPSFTLEPDPTYQVDSEPVFTLEEETPSFAVREDVFGAPDELALEPPQDRYLPEEPPATAWPPAQEAATPWAPAQDAAAPWAPAEFQPEQADWAASTEPEPWQTPAEPQPWNAPAEPQPWSAPAEPQSWPEPEPSPWSPPPPEPTPPEPEPSMPAVPVAAAATVAANGGARLSDEDVDRIARRVAELLGDKAVRDVAWEVIPDMAEVIIRDRLRELEAQVE